jgi:GT2 family glycosyltransferase
VLRFLQQAGARFAAAIRERRLPLSPRWWWQALVLEWHSAGVERPENDKPAPFDRRTLDAAYAMWLKASTTAAIPTARENTNRRAIDVVALVGEGTNIGLLLQSIAQQKLRPPTVWLVCLDDTSLLGARAAADQTPRLRIDCVGVRERSGSDGTWFPPGDQPFIALVEPRTVLAPDALERIDNVLATRDDADWIYTDDDRVVDEGRIDPYFKGAFSQALAAFDDYATRLAVVRREAIRSAGGLQASFGGAQLFELLLRYSRQGGRVDHVAEVCASRVDAVPAVLGPDHRRAVADSLFQGRAAVEVPEAGPQAMRLPRLKWLGNSRSTAITVVIPTRDRVDLLDPCLQHLERTVDSGSVRLLIVDDGSQEIETRAYLTRVERSGRFACRVLRAERRDEGFNYARLVNLAGASVDTEFMLHLNNDVEAITSGWLPQMMGWMSVQCVGVVGAKLVYPDGSLQHAGVVVSTAEGTCGHFQHRLREDDAGYQWLPHHARDVAAVTGACLLTRTDLFRSVGGFDERHFAVQFNDIDFCLRLRQAGHRVIYEPAAVLLHRSAASRGRAFDHHETLEFMRRYRRLHDPFVSRHFRAASLCTPTPIPQTSPPHTG